MCDLILLVLSLTIMWAVASSFSILAKLDLQFSKKEGI